MMKNISGCFNVYSIADATNGRKININIICILFAVIVFSLFFLLSSCNNNVEKVSSAIEGSWSIDTIYYKYYDVKICMYLNVIYFKKNNITRLPYSESRCYEIITKSNDENGNWEIIKSENSKDTIPFRMKITTNNEVFEGIHKMAFYKDEPNNLLKMEIWSDSLYIICRKGLFNYKKNLKLIDELEKISWTTRPK